MESSASDQKRFISAQELTDLSEDLGFNVAVTGFMADPTKHNFMIALWRGGCQTGAVVQELLERAHGVTIDHVAVRTVSRDPQTGAPLPEIQVHAAGHATSVLTADSQLLIVDDVWDSGRSLVALLKYLRGALGPRMPVNIHIATVFYKPERNKFLPLEPDSYVEKTNEWLVFGHELAELSDAEIKRFRPRAHDLMRQVKDLCVVLDAKI
jgi:hypoxanthine phosphoribosyltransferase